MSTDQEPDVIAEAFRSAYATLDEAAPGALDWISIAKPTRRSVPQRMWAGLAVAGATAVTVLAVAGVLTLLRGPDPGAPIGGEAVTTTPGPMARIVVVFRPGELVDAEWGAFSAVLQRYDSASEYVSVDEATAHAQALTFHANDTETAGLIDSRPGLVTGYARVDIADREQAFAFQEAVGGFDFVIAAVGVNGPRLGAGYGTVPGLSPEEDALRASLWQLFYAGDLPPEIQDDSPTTTVVAQPATVQEAERLPDGTRVEFGGWVVVDGGRTLLTNASLDVDPPAYESGLDLYDVDLATLDLFQYPNSELRWSDIYLVSGTMRDGDLYAESIELLKINPSRLRIEACQRAAAESASHEGICPERWYAFYQEELAES